MKYISFRDRYAFPKVTAVGMATDQNVEAVHLYVPPIHPKQRVYLYMQIPTPDGTRHDVAQLMNNQIMITQDIAAVSGDISCYCEVQDPDGVMLWHSDLFVLQVRALNDMTGEIEKEFPSALQQAMSQTAADRDAAQASASAAKSSEDAAAASEQSAAQAVKTAVECADVASDAAASASRSSGTASAAAESAARSEANIAKLMASKANKVDLDAVEDHVDDLQTAVDGKQETLIAGSGIEIAADGKTISATGGGGQVVDVQIDSQSIVMDGVANIPKAGANMMGVVSGGKADFGVMVSGAGEILTMPATNSNIASRVNSDGYGVQAINRKPIVPTHLNYAVKAALTDNKRIGTQGDGLTQDEMDKACEVLGAKREKDWVLKGTLTTENKDTGVAVDLTGCTEVIIDGVTQGTASALFEFLPSASAIINGVVASGMRRFRAYFVEFMDGWMTINAKYLTNGNEKSKYVTSQLSTYDWLDRKLSGITGFLFDNPEVVTTCSIKIYAR